MAPAGGPFTTSGTVRPGRKPQTRKPRARLDRGPGLLLCPGGSRAQGPHDRPLGGRTAATCVWPGRVPWPLSPQGMSVGLRGQKGAGIPLGHLCPWAASWVTPRPARCVQRQGASFPDPRLIAQAHKVVGTEDGVAPPGSQPGFLFALWAASQRERGSPGGDLHRLCLAGPRQVPGARGASSSWPWSARGPWGTPGPGVSGTCSVNGK